MNYTKPMIELVYEIRRMVPSEFKPSIKMANPELFDELADHYHRGARTTTKALIKELLFLAGEHWSALLIKPARHESGLHNHQTRMYRGVVSLEEKRANTHAEPAVNEKIPSTAKRVYRGQVIA